MRKPLPPKVLYAIFAAVVVLVIYMFGRPAPIPVEVGKVTVGPMQVTVDEQGETQCKDRFVITSPVSGNLARITLRDGDPVTKGEVLALIAPVPLSVQEREGQQARIAAAEGELASATELVHRAQADLAQARRDSARTAKMVKDGFVSPQAAELAQTKETSLADELDAARYRAKAAAAQVRLAKSGLLAERATRGTLFKVRSPVAGRILRITDRSERVVQAGSVLLALGDISKLEVKIDLLSAEAVKVRPGMPVILKNWGGSEPLHARVRMVEPYAYTKVSALGVEEQRTNVIADLVDPPASLGDGYRVDAHIVIWQKDKVLTVPASALFRCADKWCVFTVEKKRAKQRVVKIGQRNDEVAEVLGGLKAGEVVIRHPANEVADGVRVKE